MIVFKHAQSIDKYLLRCKKQGLKIGFVPTMGALHQGHISLIKASQNTAELTVCSIFVNPTQFNDPADFQNYPSTLAADMDILLSVGCDVLFIPTVKEMYPNGLSDPQKIDFGFTAKTLEGEHRPGHFAGMAQIVEKLLRIVKPDFLFMGQKDYQQQLIVGQLIKKRRFGAHLMVCPIVRERDGLAMSSRNVRLDKKSRMLAVKISETLKGIKTASAKPSKTIKGLEEEAFARLLAIKGITPEYFAIRNAATLKPVRRRTEKMVALTAVWIGGVRLIDNMLLN